MSLYWRLVTTAVASIFIATFIGHFLVERLDRIDNRLTFKSEVSQFHKDLIENYSPSQITNSFGNEEFDELPFLIAVSKVEPEQLEVIKEISENRYQVWLSVKNSGIYISYSDIELDAEELLEQHEEEQGLLSELETLLLLITTTLIVSLAFIWLSGSLKKQIATIEMASKKIGEGDFSHKLEVEALAPFDTFALTINKMQIKIQSLLNKYRTFSFAIPHELRTPLSKYRFALDMSRNFDSVEQYRSLVEMLDQYTDELEVLVDNLLTLGDDQSECKKEPVQLSVLLAKVEKKNPKIRLSVDLKLEKIFAHPIYLETVLNNLVENAAKYGASKCKISAYRNSEKNIILVNDDGPGVEQQDIERIFAPFYRANQTNISEQQQKQIIKKSVGLGLAICKVLIEKQKGKISLIDGDLAGACFKITLEK